METFIFCAVLEEKALERLLLKKASDGFVNFLKNGYTLEYKLSLAEYKVELSNSHFFVDCQNPLFFTSMLLIFF